MIVLTLPYPPRLNTYYRMFRGRMLLSAAGRQYKESVALACKKAGLRPLAGPLRVFLTYYRPRQAGDLDGLFKAVLDALEGFAFEDDKQVEEIHATRRDDKANPRAEVEIREIGSPAT